MRRTKRSEVKTDGYYHDRITRALSPFCAAGCAAVAWRLGWPFFAVVTAAAVGWLGCMFCLVCNPDLDQPGLSAAETRWIKLGFFGVSLMHAWGFVWGTYTRIIPYHRHWSSHAPVVGTVLRLAYLAVVPILVIIATGNGPQALEYLWAWPYAALFAAALAVADTGHWARDVWESLKKGRSAIC